MSGWNAIDASPVVRGARHDMAGARPVAAVASTFPDGMRTGAQSHGWGQLLLATSGLLLATTGAGAWMVPAGHALWLPAGVAYDVAMHGDVAMHVVHVARDAARAPAPGCRVIPVSPLLAAVIAALVDETAKAGDSGRGGHLAALVLDEIGRAEIVPLVLPIPADRRLAGLAGALMDDPGLSRSLDDWCLAVGMSRRSLTRSFRLATGLSVGAWLRRLRRFEAVARQAAGEPAARVAAGLGYRSRSAFKAMLRREAARSDRAPQCR
ncbi:AraC family transcriptional regulator [Phreatobacter sp. AB_2022a]|uniref:AraC family transcriptional regulator n=1 Tax=Phreatobacter sp. AB_2022a TaxID=3003134 RepID=UPI002286D59D|nr:helix-turn-helix transcriptional regulator [Phreatobacter sp. AB_2022a]MCZ0733984.1 helix-turn-helix transcriptional regulator [Phreatobacter sp. AB_2022a]